MIMTLDNITASDTTGQRSVRLPKVRRDLSLGELLDGTLLPKLALPRQDSAQRPISYSIRNDRTGTYVRRSESVGDVLSSNDRLVLQPQIDAGGSAL